jgi:hypothetical protein
MHAMMMLGPFYFLRGVPGSHYYQTATRQFHVNYSTFPTRARPFRVDARLLAVGAFAWQVGDTVLIA